MNDQKVFAPTPRKRRRFRENGQVVISPDLLAGCFLLAVTVVLHFCGHRLLDDSGNYLKGSLEQIQTKSFKSSDALSGYLVGQLGTSASYFLLRLWPFWVLSLVTVFTVLAQTRGLIHWAAISPDFNRINPANGIRKYAPAELWRRLLSTSVKLVGLSSIAWMWAVKHHQLSAHASLTQQTQAELKQVVGFLLVLSAGLLVWGMIDYCWRWLRNEKQLRMTSRELTEEQQQFDPDPNIRQKAQNLRQQWGTGLTLNPDTDLLITNGLTGGVLLRYDVEVDDVPRIMIRETGSTGVILLQHCMQQQLMIHESIDLQQALSHRADYLLPAEFCPQIAEIYHQSRASRLVDVAPDEPVLNPSVGE